MEQPKVFEFAKEIGIETLVLMDKIREWKLPVKSHMAALDGEMVEEIKKRLDEEATSSSGSKKKTKKKAAKKKTAAKKATTKKAPATKKVAKKAAAKVTKKVAVKKTTVKKASSADAAEKTTSKKAESAPAKKAVIRRKASEVEAKLEAEEQALKAQEAAEQQAIEDQKAAAASSAAEVAGPTEETAEAKAAEPPAPRKPRNIVGRMDLRRVSRGGGESSSSSRTPARATSTGNIRTGFVAPPSMDVPTPTTGTREESYAARREREEKAKKKAAGAKEEVATKGFSATEFRKREVIFQPKKKKSLTYGQNKKTQITTPAAHKRVVQVYGTIRVEELAQQMGMKSSGVVRKLIQNGIMANHNTELDFDTVSLIVPEFNYEAENIHKTEGEILETVAFGDLDADKVDRPPVVTVMGHVDHGKTTLLDTIRNKTVASGEAGGITQHIGAYSVKLKSGKEITFLDTPGHEAFTSMRARGANVTDVAIIVVAADDGLMPQTAEAINHAKAAGVPIIVAVNKMDKQGANPDKVKQQLTEFELVSEDWGGDTIFSHVSALKGDGVPELLESIVLVSDLQELKANPKRSASGIVIESRMEKGRGAVATVLVQDGTLEVGNIVAAGIVVGKIRSMMDDKGQRVKSIGPGYPVEINGLSETPQAGDRFDVCKDDSAAEQLVGERKEQALAETQGAGKLSIEEILSRVKKSDVKELAVVLKADVAGSLEAIKGLLDKSGSDEVKVKIIHSAIGGVSESDVLLAGTGGGIIIGFNVRPDSGAQRVAKEKGVEIKTYSIIYEMADDIKKMLSGLLSPEVKEIVQGRAEVRETFSVPKIGVIAGCSVLDGKIGRNHSLRLIREGRVVYTGQLSSLKRFKDDAKEVTSGYECGIGIENYNDIKVGDEIEAFTEESFAREL